MQDFWDKYLRTYDQLEKVHEYSDYLEQMADHCEPCSGIRILDAGSGTGCFSIRLSKRGARVTSLDFSNVAISIHKEKDPVANVHYGSLEEPLPFPNDSFDAITCTSVLFCLSPEGIRLALQEFKRVLAPSGKIVISVAKPGNRKFKLAARCILGSIIDHKVTLKKRIKTLKTMLGITYYNIRMMMYRNAGHYRRFLPEELESLIASAGFMLHHDFESYGGVMQVFVGENPAERDVSRDTIKAKDLALVG